MGHNNNRREDNAGSVSLGGRSTTDTDLTRGKTELTTTRKSCILLANNSLLEFFALLGCSVISLIPTFRYNLSVPYSGVRLFLDYLPFEDRNYRCPETSVTNYQYDKIFIYLLQLGFHPVEVVGRLVHK